MTTIGGLDVFGAGIEVRPLKEPGICFLCEACPQQDVEKVINTLRTFVPGPLTKLNGTKYVCESCATDLGKAVGLVDADAVASAEADAAAEKDRADAAEAAVAAYSALDAAVKTLTAKPKAVKAEPTS